MYNSFTFNSLQFNTVITPLAACADMLMYADIYINNARLNITIDNKELQLVI